MIYELIGMRSNISRKSP